MIDHSPSALLRSLLLSIVIVGSAATASGQETVVPPEPIPLVPPAPAAGETPPEPAKPEPEPKSIYDGIDLRPEAVNVAQFSGELIAPSDVPNALVLKLQVLLDRAGYSPGVIDGMLGGNVVKAIQVAEALLGLEQDGILDGDLWLALDVNQSRPVLAAYQITPEDLAGPFIPDLPSDYGALAKLDRAAFRTPLEMFGERFHMDERLLVALNPGVDFSAPGSTIVVADVGPAKEGPEVATLVADKTRAQIFGFDAGGKLVVAYPATIGSDEMPSPSGVHRVNGIARDAAYYYRPDVNFVQGNNRHKLTIPPGPNNPIGTTWVDLTEPTYGIHGTPEPSRIDKTNSHGCVRLTNWDVEELAGLIRKGVPVEFR